jgi:hypothetical protein
MSAPLPSTVEKYLAFLHYLKFQLGIKNPDFKISVAMVEWKLNTNLPKILIDLQHIVRTGHGQYEWVGPAPSTKMASDTVTAINKLARKKLSTNAAKTNIARITGPLEATPLGTEVKVLKSRVEELETLVLQLMEDVA